MEKNTQNPIIDLIRGFDQIENNSGLPKDNSVENQTEFFDKDLKDIQKLSMEELDNELEKLGFDEQKISAGIESAKEETVIQFPRRKENNAGGIGSRFQYSFIREIIDDAICKSFFITKKESHSITNEPEKAVITEPKNEKRPREPNPIRLVLLTIVAFTGFLCVSAPFAKNHILDLLINDLDNQLQGKTIEEQMVFLNRMNFFEKYHQNILIMTDPNYSKLQACTGGKLTYKHNIEAGDTLSKIVSHCGFKIDYDMSNFTDKLDIHDIVKMNIDKTGLINNIVIEKKSGTEKPIYSTTETSH